MTNQIPALMIFALFLLSYCWADELVDVTRLEMFVDELPDMPRIEGYRMKNGKAVPADLHIGMFPKKWKFHRDLPASEVFAYGTSKNTATIPGPTIEAIHGLRTRLTWLNHLPDRHILPSDPSIPIARPRHRGIPAVVHLHGSSHEPTNDGHPDAWFTANFTETGPAWSKPVYTYPNSQHPGNLWYHDHAMGLTRVNLLAGLLGFYILRDDAVEKPLGLPSGPGFDRPLVVFDRSFRRDGSIFLNRTGNNPSIHPQWQPEYFGDAIIVNGKAWPKMSVRRRKYRFRILNASNARFYEFFFPDGLEFTVIGSDSAYIHRPVRVSKLLLAPSEIVDVIIDFSESDSSEVVLSNNASYPFPTGDSVNERNGKVMKFVIDKKDKLDAQQYRSQIPAELVRYPVAKEKHAVRTRFIAMYEYTTSADEPTHLYMNGKSFSEPTTETPKEGTTEVWHVINLTGDNHPMHIHLALLAAMEQVELKNVTELTDCLNRENNEVGNCNLEEHITENKVAVPAHERGWKNVFKMQPNFMTKILVRFSPISHGRRRYPFKATGEPGYVYHCHILDHEDNEMMRPFSVIS